MNFRYLLYRAPLDKVGIFDIVIKAWSFDIMCAWQVLRFEANFASKESELDHIQIRQVLFLSRQSDR